jgi:MbtH protein
MNSNPDQPIEAFKVVRNYEHQYSVWPAARDVPAGWQECGLRGSRSECREHIGQVWKDILPAGVTNALSASRAGRNEAS